MRRGERCAWMSPEISGVAEQGLVVEVVAVVVIATV